MAQKWLSIVGIGEDGIEGLSAVARSIISTAEILVGGDRHLAMVARSNIQQERLVWTSPISGSIEQILAYRGRRVCVLASGDPMWYGIGVTLTHSVSINEIIIIPAPSSFSLICARLGWSISEVDTLSLCGRPASLLRSYVYPNTKLLILSAGQETPSIVAKILTEQGFGKSAITVFEHLSGTREQMISGVAEAWDIEGIAELNSIAVNCIADRKAQILSRLPGLPDHAYQHDGQLTKREVRAITLSALAPNPGELLWDVGAGCGSISIEWMRTDPRCRAISIEKSRMNYIADNANSLGVPNLQIIAGTAPAALQDLPTPNAIFIGGGATAERMFETCWEALRSGGRLVANVVTIEGEQQLFKWQQQVGGSLSRIAIQRTEPIGSFLGWKAMAPVTQWIAFKP